MTREDLDDGCMRTEKLRSSIVWPDRFPGKPRGSGRCEKPEGERSAVRVAWARRDRPVLHPDLPTRSTDRR